MAGKKLALFSFVSSAFALLLIELICRVILWFQFGIYHSGLSVQWNPRWISDEEVIWTNRPFYLENAKKFQYNEVGIRVNLGDVFMPEKKENDFWVFLFGGSAMAGMGSNKDGEWIRITGIYDHPIEESIDGYLKKMLQDKLKNKKVRVFNAAVSGHSIYQSYLRYKALSKYKPDWVISMDGVNEPASLKENENTVTYLKKEWKENPAQELSDSKSAYGIFRPACYFLLSRYVYNSRESKRVANVMDSLNYYRAKWISYPSKNLQFIKADQNIEHAVNVYLKNLNDFKTSLERAKQNYLLLLQPHLSQRDTNRLDSTEKATYNYYLNTPNKAMNTFLKLANEKVDSLSKTKGHIYPMRAINTCSGWTFVDYCHFTKEANKKIAGQICDYIISNRKHHSFEN